MIFLGNLSLTHTTQYQLLKTENIKQIKLTNTRRVSTYVGYHQWSSVILNQVILNFENEIS